MSAVIKKYQSEGRDYISVAIAPESSPKEFEQIRQACRDEGFVFDVDRRVWVAPASKLDDFRLLMKALGLSLVENTDTNTTQNREHELSAENTRFAQRDPDWKHRETIPRRYQLDNLNGYRFRLKVAEGLVQRKLNESAPYLESFVAQQRAQIKAIEDWRLAHGLAIEGCGAELRKPSRSVFRGAYFNLSSSG